MTSKNDDLIEMFDRHDKKIKPIIVILILIIGLILLENLIFGLYKTPNNSNIEIFVIVINIVSSCIFVYKRRDKQ